MINRLFQLFVCATILLSATVGVVCPTARAADPVPAAAPAVHAQVRLSPLFGDGMVLQRDRPARIWGQAAPGETVRITLNGRTVSVRADAEGNWQTNLPARKAGGPYEIAVSGGNSLTLRDVYFGDVFLLSGQSNMEWGSKSILKPEVFAAESATANDPQLRFFIVKKNPQLAPTRDLSGQWQPCTPESMAGFSGTGYFFGRELRRALGVPIGLIGSYWGGTPSEAFTSAEGLATDPAYPALKAAWETRIAEYPEKQKQYEEVVLPKWQAQADSARAEGKPIPRRPGGPMGGPADPQRPSLLYNGMIAPLVGLSLKGIAWYQGESNGDNQAEALDYKTLFPTLIRDWRARWGEDLPFLWVQLAAYRKPQEQPFEPAQWWPYVREAQTRALALPATGMAIVLDNQDPDQIHPSDKVTVGKRLADVALAVVYGRNVPYTGPLFSGMKVEGNAARLRFTHTDGGLKPRDGDLRGFAVAGEDGAFVRADARIDGDSVVVSSPQVARPVAVRYGWADNPVGNLVNGAGLPASPFRTDLDTPPARTP